MAHWHYAMLELIPEDRLIRPTVNPETTLIRTEAHAEVGGLLRKVPGAEALAGIWAAGAKDDTVYFGPFTFTIFECSGDCAVSSASVIEDYAATLRAAGADVQVARPRP